MSQLARRSTSVSFYLAVGWLLAVTAVGLLAPWLPLPFAPAVPDLLHVAEPPNGLVIPRHWLGTDPLGRDVLAQLVYGAQQLVRCVGWRGSGLLGQSWLAPATRPLAPGVSGRLVVVAATRRYTGSTGPARGGGHRLVGQILFADK
jgi:hypothetical protein